jgi:hypothetical protein
VEEENCYKVVGNWEEVYKLQHKAGKWRWMRLCAKSRTIYLVTFADSSNNYLVMCANSRLNFLVTCADSSPNILNISNPQGFTVPSKINSLLSIEY